MPSIDTDLGDNVRAAMAHRRAKQSDLAAALRISQPAVSARLAGKTPFTVAELAAVAAYLNVPVLDLLGESVAS